MPSLEVLEKIITLVNVAIYISVVILGLNTIWRVDQKFGRFIKILVSAIALVPLRLMIDLAGFGNDPVWLLVMRAMGFVLGILLLIAFAQLLNSIKSLNNEK